MLPPKPTVQTLLASTPLRTVRGAAGLGGQCLSDALTVMRLRLPDDLVRHLSSTNLIEHLIGGVRKLSARVQNWRDGQTALRWTCASEMDAASDSEDSKDTEVSLLSSRPSVITTIT